MVEWVPAGESTPEALGALLDRLWPKLKPHVPERYTTTVLAVPKKKTGIEISTEPGIWHRYHLYRVYGEPLKDPGMRARLPWWASLRRRACGPGGPTARACA